MTKQKTVVIIRTYTHVYISIIGNNKIVIKKIIDFKKTWKWGILQVKKKKKKNLKWVDLFYILNLMIKKKKPKIYKDKSDCGQCYKLIQKKKKLKIKKLK